AIARYARDPASNFAEVAFVVSDEYQNRGIGSYLMQHLTTIGRERGLGGFTADVLANNAKMQRVLHKTGCRTESQLSGDTYELKIIF
ncbi:MAG: GNAT family N-acetyltransferase, partial [Myxococcota bacterium]